MSYINTEEMRRAAQTADAAADSMRRSAGEVEEAVRRLEQLLVEGYGGNALRLIELLENLEVPEPVAVASPQVTDEQIERLREAITDSLTSVYVCGRVWSAWSVGTMSEQDFSPAGQDGDVVENIVSAVISALSAPPAAETRACGDFGEVGTGPSLDSADVSEVLKAASQEAKPVAAVPKLPSYPDMVRWDSHMPAPVLYYAEANVLAMFAAAPQEQAPAICILDPNATFQQMRIPERVDLNAIQESKLHAHKWDRDGDHCEKCGDSDWMGGNCSVADDSSKVVEVDAIDANRYRHIRLNISRLHSALFHGATPLMRKGGILPWGHKVDSIIDADIALQSQPQQVTK